MYKLFRMVSVSMVDSANLFCACLMAGSSIDYRSACRGDYAQPIEQPIYSFMAPPDGRNPIASVIVDSGTVIVYGVTTKGGTNGRGTVFQLTPPTMQGAGWAWKR